MLIMFVYWINSSLNPYWNSHLEQNWNIHEYSKLIHVPGISGKQGSIFGNERTSMTLIRNAYKFYSSEINNILVLITDKIKGQLEQN